MYSAEISASKGMPTSIIFLVDQSGSMNDPWGKGGKKKSEAVAIAINRLLNMILIRCTKNDGIRNYFDIAVIGYGVGSRAQFAWTGDLQGKELVTVNDLSDNVKFIKTKKKIDAGDGTLIETEVEVPQWFEPVADGTTPMHEALKIARELLEKWIVKYPKSFPPMIFNITDGQPDDKREAEKEAGLLKSMETEDGKVLLFNIHISERQGQEIVFPEKENLLPDDNAKLLFRMSSELPKTFKLLAKQSMEDITITESAKGFLFNADAVKLIEFIDIGTKVTDVRELGIS